MPRQRPPQTEAANLDPVALCIAIWLGLIVAIAGVTRVAQSDRPTAAPPAIAAIY